MGIDSSHAGLAHEFAFDVLGLGHVVESMKVCELEGWDGGVGGMLEKERLAVAAVLWRKGVSGEWRMLGWA